MAQHIEIADDADVIQWQYRNPETNEAFDSVFTLRVVPSAKQRELRRLHTKHLFIRGSRQEDFDWAKFNDDCIDFAIVDWRDVKRRGADVPCTRETKLQLPEMVKIEIIRLCLGRELGREAVDDADERALEHAYAVPEGEQGPRPLPTRVRS